MLLGDSKSYVTEKPENLEEPHDDLGQKDRLFFWHLSFMKNEEEKSIGMFLLLILGFSKLSFQR